MFSIFVPDIYQKSIFDINFKKLKRNGIKCIIFDLDNTLAPINVKSPSKKVKDLMEDLKELK
ncbi:MAG: YqeG family HAD IIIA-type phosphatase, partial [Bacilli bacterium]|nr:YqeG family HAD IIIA-type phosphatase [Bacilli bacterium]MDD4408000.1 YqeG family HAD IIIA-type phosphatase [Bacilli bacterium]